ncbi:MAG: cyclic nucleotide-binding protein, partial [Desulfobacterales bacterium]|nr:cyclic nucleotide-binding protein [Desulfobacterales bacterium]
MALKLKHLIDVHEEELSLFLWSMLLLMLLRSSGIILNNFAETAFLKRYGVEYLPVVYMLNSVITFVVMARLSALMARLEGNQILSYVLIFCAVSMVVLRFILSLDFSLIYPLLFVLKAQFDILLGLLFWNLANDLFNVRQSKRLFPLIVAGGVTGEIIGSFCTPLIGQLTSINNLMLVYAVNIMLAFVTITRMRFRFPTLLRVKKPTRAPKFKPALPEQFRNIRMVMRETPLVTVLIFLTLLPNIIIPVLNYQFNYAVNSQFATEAGMIQFFGVFRGVMNIVSLCLLLFVGKVYNRIGLPVALMFHPCNYFLVFMAFLFRFDVFSAMYARLSTNVIRTTLNKPVTDVLMGIFPTSYRNKIRPFLRGTVVRIGLFTGSGLVLLSEDICHPRYLSLAIFPVVLAWIFTTVYLKRNYSGILSNLLSKDMLDLKALEDRDVSHLFRETAPTDNLVRTFLDARGEEAVWHARLLKSVDLPGLDTHILSSLEHQDPETRIALLDMISGQAESLDTEKLVPMAETRNPKLFAATLKVLKRTGADTAGLVKPEMTAPDMPVEVRAYATAFLYGRQPDQYRSLVATWLLSEDDDDRTAGVIAAGESGDTAHERRLEHLLDTGADPLLIPLLLHALSVLGSQNMSRYTAAYLTHAGEAVRQAGLEVTEITDDQTMHQVIPLLADR